MKLRFLESVENIDIRNYLFVRSIKTVGTGVENYIRPGIWLSGSSGIATMSSANMNATNLSSTFIVFYLSGGCFAALFWAFGGRSWGAPLWCSGGAISECLVH